MTTKKLILTGVFGVSLSIAVFFAVGIFLIPNIQQDKLNEYTEMEIVKQFQLTYPESAMVATSGTVLEQTWSFTHFQNARMASLTFYQGVDGNSVSYKCERIHEDDVVEIFNFENPTVQTIRDNVCGPNS